MYCRYVDICLLMMGVWSVAGRPCMTVMRNTVMLSMVEIPSVIFSPDSAGIRNTNLRNNHLATWELCTVFAVKTNLLKCAILRKHSRGYWQLSVLLRWSVNSEQWSAKHRTFSLQGTTMPMVYPRILELQTKVREGFTITEKGLSHLRHYYKTLR